MSVAASAVAASPRLGAPRSRASSSSSSSSRSSSSIPSSPAFNIARRRRSESGVGVGAARASSSSDASSPPVVSPEFECPRLTSAFALEPRPSPFSEGSEKYSNGMGQRFVEDDDCVLLNALANEPIDLGAADQVNDHHDHDAPKNATAWSGRWATRAGPRETIYFDPSEVKAAIVTCGGLCPGLNDVVRQLVFTLEEYGVEDIKGVRYGFRGFTEQKGELERPMKLTSRMVETIHLDGGSVLGSSRGGSVTSEIVDGIAEMDLDFLFVIGGNGSHAGALAIDNLCKERGVCCAVMGVPKTIDNDILLLDRTFGFNTAVDEAIKAIRSAAIEARSAMNCIGLVRLMGRSSGFIAMNASLASGEVDVCLIPEINTPLEGPGGVLAHIRRVLNRKQHCVVVVAEGAGQDILGKIGETDASGNPVLQNFAKFLQNEINADMKADLSVDVKYIDPTYMVRACPTNASDAIYCSILGQNAVHAAFAGYSGATVGLCNGHYVYLPIPPVIKSAREVDPDGRMWERLKLAINQPVFSGEGATEGDGAKKASKAR